MNNKLLKEKFNKFIINEPLFVNDDAVKEFDVSILNDKKTSLFLGVGLVTSARITQGIPFDILGMILPAEKIRRKFHLDKIIIQIADSHAKSMGFKSAEIDSATEKVNVILDRIKTRLDLKHMIIFKSSKFDPKRVNKQFEEKLRSHPQVNNKYIEQEVTDIEFIKNRFHCNIKLSWIIPGVDNSGNDERLFDQIFTDISSGVSFLHLQPGFTFNKKRWRVSPYIHETSLERILIEKDQLVQEKFQIAQNLWKDKSIGGAKNHIKQIVRAFESLFGNIQDKSLEEKVIEINGIITK